MNQGGEPEQDDYGLPRVDIQIPDDARELDRDVQAYYRELRASRREERSRRWRVPLHRTGMVVPLIAGCLVLAMLASMALTMFSANPYFSGIAGQEPPSPSASASGSGSSPASSGSAGASSPVTGPASAPAIGGAAATPSLSAGMRLPGQTISVAGRPVSLRTLTSTALAIVPARCKCARVIGRLLAQAATAGVPVYLVGKRGSQSELASLTPSDSTATAVVAIDGRNVLYSAYRVVDVTILLVDSHGSVRIQHGLPPGVTLEAALKSLKRSK